MLKMLLNPWKYYSDNSTVIHEKEIEQQQRKTLTKMCIFAKKKLVLSWELLFV